MSKSGRLTKSISLLITVTCLTSLAIMVTGHAPMSTYYNFGHLSRVSSPKSSSSQVSNSGSRTSSSSSSSNPSGYALLGHLRSPFIERTIKASPVIPTCSQLREMWIRSMYGSKVASKFVHNLKEASNQGERSRLQSASSSYLDDEIESNQISSLPATSYYYNLMRSGASGGGPPAFGHIEYHSKDSDPSILSSSSSSTSRSLSRDQSKDSHHHHHHQDEEEEEEKEESEDVVDDQFGIPGKFSDGPIPDSQLGPVFGHVIVGQDGRKTLGGSFGHFDKESSQDDTFGHVKMSPTRTPGGERMRETSRRPAVVLGASSSPGAAGRSRSAGSGSSSSSLSASDFFNAVWHDSPAKVIV